MRYCGFDERTLAGFLWPPRPGSKQAITVSRLSAHERAGEWAQIKKNGTGSVLFVSPDRVACSIRRECKRHLQWKPPSGIHAAFADLPGTGWYVFFAELLHNKVHDPNLKDIHYIHDIGVADGEYLAGSSFQERQALLQELFPTTAAPLHGVGYRVIDRHTWLATNYKPNLTKPGFVALFQSLMRQEDEGVVLKVPTAKLRFCVNEGANDEWQFKCRRPTPNAHH